MFENIDVQPKKFWGLVGVKIKRAGIPKTLLHNDSIASEPGAKAELCNEYFFHPI